ncbi:ribonuclease H-like domain-containing protein [Tanacetum coccineum]
MEQLFGHTDYPIWEVIQTGNGLVSVSTDTNGVIKVLPPKTTEEILARERERKARTTLLMALPEDHLAKFHKMTDAREIQEAIKSRFGGNDESKKMQKYILKQQFEGFTVSNSKGIHKGYDRFQSLLSQLEIHGAGVSTEDANHKFLRSKGNQDSRRRDAWNTQNKDKDNGRRSGKQEEPKALVTLDGEAVQAKKQREQLGDASIEIQAYTQALKKVEAQLVAHQQNPLWHEEKIRFMKIDLDDKTDMSARDKARLGSSDIEDSPVNNRYAEGKHAVPPPMTGIYIPSGPDNDIDDLQFTYGPKQSKPSESDARNSDFTSCESILVKSVSAIGGKWETIVKPLACCNWRPKRNYWNKVSKYNGGSNSRNCVTFKDPLGLSTKSFKEQRIVDSGCSRHMTGNKSHLAKYQDYNGGPVSFRGSKGYITGKDDFSRDFIEFCGSKGIKREYSNARTPQQNGVAERKNMTLIEAARTMLADSFLPKHFWAKAGKGPNWLFDLDYLTDSMNYQHVRSENQANKHVGPKEANHNAGTQDNIDAGNSEMEAESAQDYFVLPIWSSYTSTIKSSEANNEGKKYTKNTDLKTNENPVDLEDQAFLDELERLKRQEKEANDAAEALKRVCPKY